VTNFEILSQNLIWETEE